MDDFFMKEALNLAKIAFDSDEVPVGCVIVKDNNIIASSYNRKELDGIATYHAEILAINDACKKLGTWHLEDCTLYTTVEPCMMCTGAIIQSRIGRVVYGASNDSFGYLSKINNNKKIVINGGVMREKCLLLLSDFFKKKRIDNNL